MNLVFKTIRRHLQEHENYLKCFYSHAVQVEGWFKGELLLLLENMKAERKIIGFDREIPSLKRKKIDLAIDLKDGRHWVELKHWFIGTQKGNKWRLKDYSLEDELRKFRAINVGNNGWILVICTHNPGSKEWATYIDNFNKDYPPWKLIAKTSPRNYPKTYFLGVLQVAGL